MSDLFFEEQGYVVNCYTSEPEEDKFRVSVIIERKADFVAGKTAIPGVRHVIHHEFTSSTDALQAGVALAYEKIAGGTTGLE